MRGTESRRGDRESGDDARGGSLCRGAAETGGGTYLLQNMAEHGTQTFDLVDPATGTVAEGASLYRKGVTSENYWHVLDSIGLTIRYRTANDTETMNAEYLTRNIDQAFEGRERYPWAAHYADSVFLRYVLSYRIDAEELTDWRTSFWARYEPMIDTPFDPENSAQRGPADYPGCQQPVSVL